MYKLLKKTNPLKNQGVLKYSHEKQFSINNRNEPGKSEEQFTS
jgi:hypothetical protein